MNMVRLGTFLAGWTIVVPWLAAFVWLASERLMSEPSATVPQAISDAALFAIFGVVFSWIVTVPLCLLVMYWLLAWPHLFKKRPVRVVFTAMLSVTGVGAACFLVKDAGFENMAWVTFLIGGLSGVALARISIGTLILNGRGRGAPAD
jgi:hypothetical protein